MPEDRDAPAQGSHWEEVVTSFLRDSRARREMFLAATLGEAHPAPLRLMNGETPAGLRRREEIAAARGEDWIGPIEAERPSTAFMDFAEHLTRTIYAATDVARRDGEGFTVVTFDDPGRVETGIGSAAARAEVQAADRYYYAHGNRVVFGEMELEIREADRVRCPATADTIRGSCVPCVSEVPIDNGPRFHRPGAGHEMRKLVMWMDAHQTGGPAAFFRASIEEATWVRGGKAAVAGEAMTNGDLRAAALVLCREEQAQQFFDGMAEITGAKMAEKNLRWALVPCRDPRRLAMWEGVFEGRFRKPLLTAKKGRWCRCAERTPILEMLTDDGRCRWQACERCGGEVAGRREGVVCVHPNGDLA